METFILYLYICAGSASCQWMANGQFNASLEMVDAPSASIPMIMRKTYKANAKQMCELAAKELKVMEVHLRRSAPYDSTSILRMA